MYQSHSYSISPDSFTTDEGLKSKFRLTSIQHSTDDAGTPFTATMESPDYPFLGMQFHPEKVAYMFNDNHNYNHSEESLILNDFFYRKFVADSRANTQSYGTFAETQTILVNNADTFNGTDYYGQVYLFK